MKTIVVATKNTEKLKEMMDAFRDLPVTLFPLSQFGDLPDAVRCYRLHPGCQAGLAPPCARACASKRLCRRGEFYGRARHQRHGQAVLSV